MISLILLLSGNVNLLVFAAFRENVALSKDVRQSSLAFNGYATYGNDGILIQDWFIYKCTHTTMGQNMGYEYWWAVDLGVPYNIDSVTVYNRKDGLGDRLYDFYAYVFNPSTPTWGAFNAEEPMLCYFHGGQSPDILNFSCNKRTVGRYLQIYKKYRHRPNGGDALTLCEVQVYSKQDKLASRFGNEKTKRPIKLISSITYILLQECAVNCSAVENCIGYNISGGNTCELYQTSMTVENADDSLDYYEKC